MPRYNSLGETVCANMNSLLLVFLASLSWSLSSPAPNNASVMRCKQLLKEAGATDYYGPSVGHAIHSLSLQELQKFDPTATEDNHIPNINMDLLSPNPLLPNVVYQKGPDDAKFITEGMKALDYVLSNMDKEAWDIRSFGTLERVVHIFHMKEVWARALRDFQTLKASPPSDEVCTCATDLDATGIMKMLRYTALAIREPKLIYGQDPAKNDRGYYIPYKYTYHFFAKHDMSDQLGDEILKSLDDSMPHLTDVKSWNTWKKIGHVSHKADRDLALYLFCVTTQNKKKPA